MDAFWARHVFNRTLRCAEAGCALALLDWPAANVGKETELAARPTCESFRLSDSVRPKLFFVKQMLNFNCFKKKLDRAGTIGRRSDTFDLTGGRARALTGPPDASPAASASRVLRPSSPCG